MYFVYIIHSKIKNRFYAGLTNNINRRLKEHKRIKKINDFELLHCEICKNRKEARKLEKYFKSGYGREIRNEIFNTKMVGVA